MSVLFLVEGVVGQSRRIALDELDIAGLGEDPDGRLLVAHATVAVRGLLDLGQRDLIDEGGAVAVATVRLELFLLFSHCENETR